MKKLAAVWAMAVLAIGLVTVGAHADHVDPNKCDSLEAKCTLLIAETYMNAQTIPGAAATMRIASNAKRWENGRVTGVSGQDIKGNGGGAPAPAGLGEHARDYRGWADDQGNVFYYWLIDAGASVTASPQQAPAVSTAHIAERFKIGTPPAGERCLVGEAPCILEIEAIFCIGPQGGEAAMPDETTRAQVNEFLCYRGSRQATNQESPQHG